MNNIIKGPANVYGMVEYKGSIYKINTLGIIKDIDLVHDEYLVNLDEIAGDTNVDVWVNSKVVHTIFS